MREFISEIEANVSQKLNEYIINDNQDALEEKLEPEENEENKPFEYEAIPSAEITINVDIQNEPIEEVP